ncbi:MAG: hypothetical protein NTU51_00120 [Bacteroidetes bacterium]|nr:hypothetical protein [Bacteroidota bacterium]
MNFSKKRTLVRTFYCIHSVIMRTSFIVALLVFRLMTSAQNINLSQGLYFDGEPYMAIDPANERHMVVAWMGYIPYQQIAIKTSATFNGGMNWSQVQSIPHVSPGFTSADPSLAFDGSGNVFLAYIDYRKSPDSGAVYVVKSADGGLSWSQRSKVIDAWDDALKRPIDRPFLTIDRSGGTYNGRMYITTKPAQWIPPPNRPYFIRSTDNGQSWGNWRYLDTLNWLAGPYIAGPMAAPETGSNGMFYAIYPSWELTQSLLPRFIIARSSDGGASFNYHWVIAGAAGVNDTLSKKGYRLISDPTDPSHLAFFRISPMFGDPDVVMLESHNGGITWADTTRVNDDPAGNGRMQELAWAGFSSVGDIISAWRDRRHAPDTGYATSYEIYGAVRWHDSIRFSPNFRISDTIIGYNQVLAGKGNDFMNVVMADDTMSAVWADTRDGRLNIWFQHTDLHHPNPGGIRPVASEIQPWLRYGPNPVKEILWAEAPGLARLILYDLKGNAVRTLSITHPGHDAVRSAAMQLSGLPPGEYMMEAFTDRGNLVQKIIKN